MIKEESNSLRSKSNPNPNQYSFSTKATTHQVMIEESGSTSKTLEQIDFDSPGDDLVTNKNK